MLNIITNGYVLPFLSKPNLVRFPLILSEYKAPSKRLSSGHLYPVSSVKEHNRKGIKCKISPVLQSPVPSTQASPKVEASHRPKQAQHFSTHRKVQNGNSIVHQDLPDSRGMGIVDRPIRRLPSHPHPSKLKEIPKVLLQVLGAPVHLPPIRTSHSPPGLYNDCKGSEANGPLQRTQTSPIPGRLAQEEGQVNTQAMVDLTRSLGWIINQEKSELKPTQVFSFVGYEYHLDSALVKHTQDLTKTQLKTCLDCKMFDVANWVACLNRGNGPGGTPSPETLSVSPQGALEISPVAGQPPSFDRTHCSTL